MVSYARVPSVKVTLYSVYIYILEDYPLWETANVFTPGPLTGPKKIDKHF